MKHVMMDRIILRIHSFIDLITNSSTEIFSSSNVIPLADSNTIKQLKNIIDEIILTTNIYSPLRADDLFDFELYDSGEGNSLQVIAKNPDDKRLAELLTNISNIFSDYAVCN